MLSLGRGTWPRWGSDGYIYASVDSGTVRIPEAGGPAEPVTRLGDGEQGHRFSAILPSGGRALLGVGTGGEIEIQTSPGSGTRIDLILPSDTGLLSTSAPVDSPAEKPVASWFARVREPRRRLDAFCHLY